MPEAFIYITKDSMKLYEQSSSHEIHSQYLENYKKNVAQINRKKEWKRNSDLAMMGGNPMAQQVSPEDSLMHTFHGCTFIDNEFLYAIQIENSTGLFRTKITQEAEAEGHVVHNTNKRYSSPCFSKAFRELVYSAMESDGTENLHMLHMDSEDELELTEGDSRDSNPSWDLSGSKAIVYQSCGIGRDAHGRFGTLGPSEINILDMEDEEILEVASSPHFDYLTPVMYDGSVYAIRRPYEGDRTQKIGLLALFMIPVNIIRTLFSWINFNSMIFRGKPLIDGDQQVKQDDIAKKLLLHGNLVDAEKEMAAARKRGEKVPALVPKSWVLVKIDTNGDETILEEGVLAFNIQESGTILLSNGSGVFTKEGENKKKLLFSERYVERIVTPR